MGARRRFRELTEHLVALLLTGYAETLEDLALLFVALGRELDPEVLVPGADVDHATRVVAVNVRAPWREDDSVESYGQLTPIGQDTDEIQDVSLLQKVAVSFARSPAVNDRNLLLRVVVICGQRPVVFLLHQAANDFGVRLTVKAFHIYCPHY